jgi:hypothetical protein
MISAHVVLALALAASEGPAVSQAESKPTGETPWELWMGLLGGVRPDSMGGGGIGELGVDRKVGRFFRPEIDVGLGAYAGPTLVETRFRIGTRLEYPRQGIVPYLWAAFAHQHESAWSDVVSDPVADLLGLSTHGVNHRSGLELGAGASYDFPRRAHDRLAGRIGLRATMVQLWGVGPPRYAEVLASVGVLF